MENIDKYFNSDSYYDPSIIVTILEDIIGKDYNDIRNDVINSGVFLTDKEIVNFLDKEFLDCDSKIKKRINNSELRYADSDKLFGENQLNFLKKHSSSLEDYLALRKYTFEPYSLEYFKIYISIIKKKILFLLDNVSDIGNDPVFLESLDIVLDSNGFMLKDDIIRLVMPILYNFDLLNSKVNEANDLYTYLSFKMSRYSLYSNGLSDNDIYPSENIQIDNLLCSEDGYVPLSINQRKKLKKKNTIY